MYKSSEFILKCLEENTIVVSLKAGKVYSLANRKGEPRELSTCMVGGYPQVKIRCSLGTKLMHVHKIVWIAANGPIPDNHVIDHISGITTDNTISNLRVATKSQNAVNRRLSNKHRTSSKYRGVSFFKAKKLYVARIGYTENGIYKNKFIKSCKSEDEAAAAWNEEAYARWGDFVTLNVIASPFDLPFWLDKKMLLAKA